MLGIGDRHPLILSEEDMANGGHVVPSQSDMSLRRKGSSKFDDISLAQAKARIAFLYKEGEVLAEIGEQVAEEFGLEKPLSPQLVSYHVREMINYWRQKGQLHIEDKQALWLARLDQIEMLATEAYFASVRGKKTTYHETLINKLNTPQVKKALKQVLEDEWYDREDEKRSEGRKLKKLKKKKRRDYLMDDESLVDILIDTAEQNAEKHKTWERFEENRAGDPRWVAIMVQVSDQRARAWGLYDRAKKLDADQDMARLGDNERTNRLMAIVTTAIQRQSVAAGTSGLAPAAPLGGFKEGEKPAEVEEIERIFDEGTDDEDDEDGWN